MPPTSTSAPGLARRRLRLQSRRAPFVRAATRDCGAGGKADPLSLLFCLWSSLPWPGPGVLTGDAKLNDNVCLEAVHAGERERCHRAPHGEGAREGVVDHVSRQVFRVVLNPAGEKAESVGGGGRAGITNERGRSSSHTPVLAPGFQNLHC